MTNIKYPGSNPGPYYGGMPSSVHGPFYGSMESVRGPAVGQTADMNMTEVGGTAVAAIVGWFCIRGIFGYFAGRAMTPPGHNPNYWGLGGIAAGAIGGPVGLGIQGGISLAMRK